MSLSLYRPKMHNIYCRFGALGWKERRREGGKQTMTTLYYHSSVTSVHVILFLLLLSDLAIAVPLLSL